MDLSSVVGHAGAAWNWASNNECQVGLSLALICVVFTALGDGALYRICSPVKAASPEVAPTAILRPLANLSLSSWLMYYVFKQIVLTFGSSAVCITLSAYFVIVTLAVGWFLKYAYHAPSKGVTINVREPKNSFGKMNYSMDVSGMSTSLFWNFAWFNLSAFLVPFELCIHIIMVCKYIETYNPYLIL